jgi:hypothetical protein
VRLGLNHAQLSNDFSSEVFLPSADPIRVRDGLRFDWAIPLHSTRVILPVTVETTRDHLASGLDNLSVSVRLSAYFRGLSLSNEVRRLTTAGVSTSDGTLQVGSRLGGFGLRGQVNYGNWGGDKGVTAAALTADRRLARGYVMSAGLTRTLINPETRYTMGLTKEVGNYGFGIGAGYSTRGEYTLTGQVFLALAREPRQTDWMFDALPMANLGGVSARVFLDKNLNGVFDEGDELIQGAAFTVNGGTRPIRTDARGIAYLPRLPVDQNVDIGLDPTSLEDPQWSAQTQGVRIVPRPGKITQVDFPVIMTAEIDGTVYFLNRQHSARGLGDIELELVDANGKVVSRTKSASDGYYVVASVPPGNYVLRVPRGQLKALGLIDTGMRVVTISPDGAFVNGVDFVVIPDWDIARPPPPQAPVKKSATETARLRATKVVPKLPRLRVS